MIPVLATEKWVVFPEQEEGVLVTVKFCSVDLFESEKFR